MVVENKKSDNSMKNKLKNAIENRSIADLSLCDISITELSPTQIRLLKMTLLQCHAQIGVLIMHCVFKTLLLVIFGNCLICGKS